MGSTNRSNENESSTDSGKSSPDENEWSFNFKEGAKEGIRDGTRSFGTSFGHAMGAATAAAVLAGIALAWRAVRSNHGD